MGSPRSEERRYTPGSLVAVKNSDHNEIAVMTTMIISSTLTPPISGSVGALYRRHRHGVTESVQRGEQWTEAEARRHHALEYAERCDGHCNQVCRQHWLPGLLCWTHHDPAVETEEILRPGAFWAVSLDLVEVLPYPERARSQCMAHSGRARRRGERGMDDRQNGQGL